MSDLSKKKSDALSKLVSMDPAAMLLVSQVQEYISYVTDNGMLTGGANAITDADCVGENSHLDAATFNAAVAALGNINLNAAQKTTLRKASRTPVPGS